MAAGTADRYPRINSGQPFGDVVAGSGDVPPISVALGSGVRG